MSIKWFLLGILFLTTYISFTESSFLDELNPNPINNNNNHKDGLLHKVWFTFSEMAQKFVDKLKSLMKIIPFFRFSDSNESHTMKVSKILDKIPPNHKEINNQEKPNVVNLMNGLIEGAKKNSELFRFKRHAGRGRFKRRRDGDDDEENEERGDDGEEEKSDEEKAAARRKRRRRVRGKGRRRY